MASIFTRIINGEIPCHKIAETDEFLAFLDITPVAIGHTLVIPKLEIDYYFDIENDLLQRLTIFSKDVAQKVRRVVPCKRIGVAIIGLEVPHAHIHLVPMNTMADINFSKERIKMSHEEMAQLALRIASS
jgi:histidine triad (HIT) family protein